ncbi:MAG: sigma-54-dependent Fis family transcriptional regulator [Nitrospina sp.]|jgi:DNA-binding NtrC family response regulator|nr:sigma-54-dependent Fis family transcriptional regulator [Nitrospina sp.]MBT3414599.1 sigma-54-dependent Fis family transcriptional regulator [Nitrospina sp.]MBT3855400.1 sigma-54-dependent Fis family transcriptional regulator [Nitrospina sp.]MBT4106054.1 sigma-54-dependent Fis family transcriptional regulator [Nitrospina sp.]MBT4388476.1 sigma-54-dependent Fis family transcriptional regulator [Nitrospina sp.]
MTPEQITKSSADKVKGKILIVEDDEGMRFFLSEALEKEGYYFQVVESGEKAIKLFAQEIFDLVILDYNLPEMNGMETFTGIKDKFPDVVAILITAFGSKDLAITAMEQGVFDYFNKPLEIGELRVVIRRGLERAFMQREVYQLRSQLETDYSFDRILGSSKAMSDVIERVRKVATSDVSVLIQGESGTGKELVAQALYAHSQRSKGPFIKVNCAAVPQELMEAEFFGYEKGAFTGAHKQKRGKFELANEGTLFLDEIGDMPLVTQMKILRVIQENELERVGGEVSIPVEFRLITATHRDLEKAVAQGEFREDLFYRLNVVSVVLPPLRNRKEDIPILVKHFLGVYSEKFKKNLKGFSSEAMESFLQHSWPGNVRELENVIQRCMVLSYDKIMGNKELLEIYPLLAGSSREVSASASLQNKLEVLVSDAEETLILEALKEENWKRQETADRLGISRKSLHNKMKKYDLGSSD